MADWLSIKEASELSGYHTEYIRQLINNGRIMAEKKGSMWWVDKTSLSDFVRAAKKSTDKRRGPKLK